MPLNLAQHLRCHDDVGGEQRVGGDQMALVGEDDGGPPLVLATLHQGMDVVHQADVGHRQLVLVAILRRTPISNIVTSTSGQSLPGRLKKCAARLPGVQKCPKASAMSLGSKGARLPSPARHWRHPPSILAPGLNF